jgi:hypothetical protein
MRYRDESDNPIPDGPSFPVDRYVEAFCLSKDTEQAEVKWEVIDHHVLIGWQGEKYLVSTFDDFVNEYKTFFAAESFEEIYTQIPCDLWGRAYEISDLERSAGEIIAAVYGYWRMYWAKQKEKSRKMERVDQMMAESFQALSVFNQAVLGDASDFVGHAIRIEEDVLVPACAFALKSFYSDPESFYTDVVTELVGSGEQYLPVNEDGFHYQIVRVGDLNEAFYIYSTEMIFVDEE